MIKILEAVKIPVDIKYNGKLGAVHGKILINKKHVANCAVKLFDQHKNRIVSESTTDDAGIYYFHNLDCNNFKFFVIAHHPTGEFNGVIADNIGGENVDS